MNPPDEEQWEELGLYDHCTCYIYNWETICPYDYEMYDEERECECCPFHSRGCFEDI